MSRPKEVWILEEMERHAAEVIPTLLADHLALTEAPEVYLFAPDAMVSLSPQLFTVRCVGKRIFGHGGVNRASATAGWQQLVPKMFKILDIDQMNMLRCSVPIAADVQGEGENVLAAHVGLPISPPATSGYDRSLTAWQSFTLPEEKPEPIFPTLPVSVHPELRETVNTIEAWVDGGYKQAAGYDWKKDLNLRLWRLDVCVLLSFGLGQLHVSVHRIGHEVPLTLDTTRDQKQVRTRALLTLFGQLPVCQLTRIKTASASFSTDMYPFFKVNWVPMDPLPRLEKGLTWAQQNRQRSERCSGQWKFEPRASAKAKHDEEMERLVRGLGRIEQRRRDMLAYRPDKGVSAPPRPNNRVSAAPKRNNRAYNAPSVPQDARYLLPKHGVVMDKVVKASKAQAMKKLMGV